MTQSNRGAGNRGAKDQRQALRSPLLAPPPTRKGGQGMTSRGVVELRRAWSPRLPGWRSAAGRLRSEAPCNRRPVPRWWAGGSRQSLQRSSFRLAQFTRKQQLTNYIINDKQNHSRGQLRVASHNSNKPALKHTGVGFWRNKMLIKKEYFDSNETTTAIIFHSIYLSAKLLQGRFVVRLQQGLNNVSNQTHRLVLPWPGDASWSHDNATFGDRDSISTLDGGFGGCEVVVQNL